MVSEEPWKEKKYWIHWRSSLESYLPAYFCTLTLWRGTASSFIFLGFVLVWFHLGIWKHGSPQMLKCLWHLRVNFFNCSERKSKTEKIIKKKGLFPFLLVFPLILPDSPWRRFSYQGLPDSLAAWETLPLSSQERGRIRDQKLFGISPSEKRPRTFLQTLKRATHWAILIYIIISVVVVIITII